MKKNKGFTLVEVIVILVILAILAAVLIPSLTTYIDKAKEKSITANARAAYVATQALLSEYYGTTKDTIAAVTSDTQLSDSTKVTEAKVIELSQLGKVYKTGTDKIQVQYDAKCSLTVFKYTEGGKTATWNNTNGSWTVS